MDYGAWVGVISFIGMFALLLMGVPVFLCMIAAALVGSWLVGGADYTFQQFSSAPYHITATFNFAVVPLFILMGELAAKCGVAEGAYSAASKWMGGLRGGILIATLAASAVFGACCGMGLAAIAVFTTIALPEIEKYRYDKSISLACIGVSGTLSSLIPPSIPIVLLCILLDISIGRGLLAGIIPGIVFTLLLMAGVWGLGILKPAAIPKSNIPITWKEKFSSLKLVGPVLFLFLLVIGGMYLGVFAPTVGGAIGSVGVLIIAFIRRVEFKTIAHCFYETVLLNAQLYPMLIGGFLFSRLITFTGLPSELMGIIVGANLSPLALMVIIVVFYLIVGSVLEFLSMLIVTLPLVFPLLTGAGFDPLVIVILVVMLGAVAGITPPIGMSVFIIAGMAKTKPEAIFRGIIPFFIISLIMIALLVFIPQMVTWLPDVLFGKISA